MSDGSETLRHDSPTANELLLIPRFKTLRPGRAESIAILNRSAAQKIVTLDSEAPQDIVSLSFDPETITVPPNQQVETEIRAMRVSALAYPEGRTFDAYLRAYASDGTQGATTITIELRPRYEWLASLLLLFGCAGAALVGLLLLTLSRPAPSPTATAPMVVVIASPTIIPSPLITMTTPPPTVVTPTFTPSPTVVPQQSCEDKGWHRYTVEAGDTLSGVLQPPTTQMLEEAAAFNNLPSDNHITEGQELCLSQVYKAKFVSLTIDASPICGVPFNAYVTIKNIGTITWNKTAHITSFANGAQVFAQDYPVSIPIGQPVTIPLSISMTNGYNQNQNLTLSAQVTGQAEQKLSSGFFLNCPQVQADFNFNVTNVTQRVYLTYWYLLDTQFENLSSPEASTFEWNISSTWTAYNPDGVILDTTQGQTIQPTNVPDTADYPVIIPLALPFHDRVPQLALYFDKWLSIVRIRTTISLTAKAAGGISDTCVKVYDMTFNPYGGGPFAPGFSKVSEDCSK
ncbi:MAG: LysM domain-containing protein [Anaerolineae bacterium]